MLNPETVFLVYLLIGLLNWGRNPVSFPHPMHSTQKPGFFLVSGIKS
jgi:hypothetical protein